MIELYGTTYYGWWNVRDMRPEIEAIDVKGRDFGGGQRGRLELIWSSANLDVMIVKSTGSTQWIAIGMQSYHPTTYYLLRYYGPSKFARWPSSYVVLAEFRFGRKWRLGLSKLEQMASRLADGRQPDDFSIREFARELRGGSE